MIRRYTGNYRIRGNVTRGFRGELEMKQWPFTYWQYATSTYHTLEICKKNLDIKVAQIVGKWTVIEQGSYTELKGIKVTDYCD